jgi:ribonuclease D
MFYVTQASEIQAVITRLASRQILWLDTEVADYDTPFPKLSLIQVSVEPLDLAGDNVYILDVFKKPDVVKYFINQIMANANIEKVFHNSSYDLQYLGKMEAQNITCTLKIARKISRDRLGTSNLKLKTLAKELCNFTDVDEEEGTSDWGRRPLSQKQLNYAKMDTVYLAQVHLHLNSWTQSNGQSTSKSKTPHGLDNSHNHYSEQAQDWTIEAMKFLSCVARTKERFGMLHIIDVLRGGKTQKILQHEHDKLSTYGIGKDKTLDEWRILGRSLLEQGLLEQNGDDYPVLKLNALSWEVMQKKRTVSITIPVAQKITWEDDNEKAAEVEVLMQRLRSLRKQLAEEQSLPPHFIFQNSTLELMAQLQPQTKEEFSKLSGVGSYKLAQYGDKFLAEIGDHRTEQGLPEQANLDRQIQKVEIPKNSEDFDRVDKLIEQLKQSLESLSSDKIPEDVQRFLKAAAKSGATIDLLTLEVKEWLIQHRLAESLRIRLT